MGKTRGIKSAKGKTLEEYSRRYGRGVTYLSRIRKSGVDLNDEAAVWARISQSVRGPKATVGARHRDLLGRPKDAMRPFAPAPRPPDAPPREYIATAPDTIQRGAAAALKRMEEREALLHARLTTAEAEGDEQLAAVLRREWKDVSEGLRRFDLMVETNRRDAGELVPRAEVERVLDRAGYWIRIGLAQFIDGYARQLHAAQDPAEMLKIIQANLGRSMQGTLAAADTCVSPLPVWAREAMIRALRLEGGR